MFLTDSTFLIYLGWMAAGWGLFLLAALILLRFVKNWLLASLINFHQLRQDLAEDCPEQEEVEVQVGEDLTLPPLPLYTTRHVGLGIVRSHTYPARPPAISREIPDPPSPPSPSPPSPPPLYHEVVTIVPDLHPQSITSCTSIDPPLYSDLYPISPNLHQVSSNLQPPSPRPEIVSEEEIVEWDPILPGQTLNVELDLRRHSLREDSEQRRPSTQSDTKLGNFYNNRCDKKNLKRQSASCDKLHT